VRRSISIIRCRKKGGGAAATAACHGALAGAHGADQNRLDFASIEPAALPKTKRRPKRAAKVSGEHEYQFGFVQVLATPYGLRMPGGLTVAELT